MARGVVLLAGVLVCGLSGVAQAESVRARVMLGMGVWKAQADGGMKQVARPVIEAEVGTSVELSLSSIKEGATLRLVPRWERDVVCVEGVIVVGEAKQAVRGCFAEGGSLVVPVPGVAGAYEVRIGAR
jgi:hypothetical protein